MKKYLFFLFILTTTITVFSQSDSLVLKNGDVIIGDLKEMSRAVAIIETDYSKSDFQIEWDGIKEIYTEQSYLITISDGERFNGKIQSVSDKNVKVLLDDGATEQIPFMDIVYIKAIDEGFWNKIAAYIDIGLDMTKANDQVTLSTRSGIEYLAPRWSTGLTFNTNITQQTEGPNTNRTDGALGFNYYLPKDFYIPVSVNYLHSTEQNLDARWTISAGAGYYFFQTNTFYWGVDLGAAYNNELYIPDSIPDNKSMEGFVGTTLNLFDIGDFSLMTSARVYPSFTEKGRWRSDFSLDTKYDLPYEFYIKVGFSLNYDNQPVAGGSDSDYTLHTGIGWSWP